MDKSEPHVRTWLKEAYKIYRGDKSIRAKKEHVIFAVKALVEVQMQSKQLQNLMEYAYKEACRRREEAGLPLPPAPPQLMRGPELE